MITLLTHSDLDGVGCSVLAKRSFKNEKLIIKYCDYPDIDTCISECLDQGEAQRLIITDISPRSEAVCLRLDNLHRKKALAIVVLDHHKTSAHLVNHPWGLHDDTKCGTTLFYDWLIYKNWLPASAVTRRFVDAIDAYDRWILDSSSRERGERLNRLCHFMGFDKFTNIFATYLDADEDSPLDFIDEILVEKQKRYVEHVIATQLTRDSIPPVDSKGRSFVVTYCDRHISQVCNAILDLFPLVVYAVNLDLARNVGDLRSRKGEIDVSVIAKQLGGGGHPSAAGFPMLLREVLFEEIHKRLQGLPA